MLIWGVVIMNWLFLKGGMSERESGHSV